MLRPRPAKGTKPDLYLNTPLFVPYTVILTYLYNNQVQNKITKIDKCSFRFLLTNIRFICVLKKYTSTSD